MTEATPPPLAPGEVEVEGSIFQTADLPRILGNYMRGHDTHARNEKTLALRIDTLAAERDALTTRIDAALQILNPGPAAALGQATMRHLDRLIIDLRDILTGQQRSPKGSDA